LLGALGSPGGMLFVGNSSFGLRLKEEMVVEKEVVVEMKQVTSFVLYCQAAMQCISLLLL